MANKNKKQASTLGKNDVYFNCNGCGKCCTGDLQIYINEYLKYSHIFMYSYELTYSIFGKLSDNLFNINMERNPSMYFVTLDDITIAFDIGINAKSYTGMCVNLVDNKCSIYDDRPIACLTTPIYQRGANILDFSSFKSDMLRMNDKLFVNNCISFMPRNNFQQIINNGQLVDKEFEQCIKIENYYKIDDTDINFPLIEYIIKQNGKQFKTLVDNFISNPSRTDGYFLYNLHLAQTLYLNGYITLDAYETATHNQNILHQNILPKLKNINHIGYVNNQSKLLQMCLDEIKNIRANN